MTGRVHMLKKQNNIAILPAKALQCLTFQSATFKELLNWCWRRRRWREQKVKVLRVSFNVMRKAITGELSSTRKGLVVYVCMLTETVT